MHNLKLNQNLLFQFLGFVVLVLLLVLRLLHIKNQDLATVLRANRLWNQVEKEIHMRAKLLVHLLLLLLVPPLLKLRTILKQTYVFFLHQELYAPLITAVF